MAEISQKDQLALHEFSVRYRQGFAQANPTSEASIDTVKAAVREEYAREQQQQRTPSIEPSSPTPEREPDQPEPET